MDFPRNRGLGNWGVVCAALAMLLVGHQARGEIEFGIPTPLPDPINDAGGSGNAHAWLSPDELTMHFATTRQGGNGLVDIWASERESTTAPWQAPQNLGPTINSGLINYMPSLTADELEIYYVQTTDPIGVSDAEIWVARRPSVDALWSEPEKLAVTILSDVFPSVSPDGLKLYFSSIRETEESPTSQNLWVASRASRSDPFGEPEFIQSGNGYPTLSPDGLTFSFYGNNQHFEFYGVPRVGDALQDILLRTRQLPDEEFGPVFNPWAPLNSSSDDYITQFGPESPIVLITSNRPGVPTGGILGEFGIWQAPIAEAVPVDIKPDDDDGDDDDGDDDDGDDDDGDDDDGDDDDGDDDDGDDDDGDDDRGGNPVNLKSRGKLPVAILSTEEFDAMQVDPSTLLFGDPVLIADGATPVAPRRESVEDVNDDDLDDLVLKFRMRELLENGVLGPETEQGYLTGTTYGGEVIAGRDAIRIVPGGVNASIPEPSTLALAACCLLCLACWRRRTG